jgi:DNA-binding NarL/FixJ family response regulator
VEQKSDFRVPQRTIVVDDTPSTARAIRAFLEGEIGTEVAGVAHSGENAIELARNVRPELALVDLFMPGISGLEVVRQVRSVSPQTRFIIVTVLGEDMSETCRGAGVEGFVVKNRLQEMLPAEIARLFPKSSSLQ